MRGLHDAFRELPQLWRRPALSATSTSEAARSHPQPGSCPHSGSTQPSRFAPLSARAISADLRVRRMKGIRCKVCIARGCLGCEWPSSLPMVRVPQRSQDRTRLALRAARQKIASTISLAARVLVLPYASRTQAKLPPRRTRRNHACRPVEPGDNLAAGHAAGLDAVGSRSKRRVNHVDIDAHIAPASGETMDKASSTILRTPRRCTTLSV